MSLLAICQPNILYGGPGRHCPAVLNPFLDNSLRCLSIYYTAKLNYRQPLVLRWQVVTIFLFWARNSSRFWIRACSHSAWVLNLACSPDSGTGPSTLNVNTQINVRFMIYSPTCYTYDFTVGNLLGQSTPAINLFDFSSSEHHTQVHDRIVSVPAGLGAM